MNSLPSLSHPIYIPRRPWLLVPAPARANFRVSASTPAFPSRSCSMPTRPNDIVENLPRGSITSSIAVPGRAATPAGAGESSVTRDVRSVNDAKKAKETASIPSRHPSRLPVGSLPRTRRQRANRPVPPPLLERTRKRPTRTSSWSRFPTTMKRQARRQKGHDHRHHDALARHPRCIYSGWWPWQQRQTPQMPPSPFHRPVATQTETIGTTPRRPHRTARVLRRPTRPARRAACLPSPPNWHPPTLSFTAPIQAVSRRPRFPEASRAPLLPP